MSDETSGKVNPSEPEISKGTPISRELAQKFAPPNDDVKRAFASGTYPRTPIELLPILPELGPQPNPTPTPLQRLSASLQSVMSSVTSLFKAKPSSPAISSSPVGSGLGFTPKVETTTSHKMSSAERSVAFAPTPSPPVEGKTPEV